MAKELTDYRANLEAILAFTGGRHELNVKQVMLYCDGKVHTDYTATKKRFPFRGNRISAPTLARCMCSEEK